MPLNNLKALLIEQLNELYSGAAHTMRILPVLADAAAAPDLARALRTLEEKARVHIDRLERVFDELGVRPRPAESSGMRGLLQDCLSLARDTDAEPHVRDAALIAVAQHVAHDVIAGYGCAKSWTGLLGYHDAGLILRRTLLEIKEADAHLTALAERVNPAALEPAST